MNIEERINEIRGAIATGDNEGALMALKMLGLDLTSDDPLSLLTLDEQLDLRAALTEAIDKHGKMPEDEGELELVNRWQNLAERLDEHSDMEAS
jgi:hypothetical protein